MSSAALVIGALRVYILLCILTAGMPCTQYIFSIITDYTI